MKRNIEKAISEAVAKSLEEQLELDNIQEYIHKCMVEIFDNNLFTNRNLAASIEKIIMDKFTDKYLNENYIKLSETINLTDFGKLANFIISKKILK